MNRTKVPQTDSIQELAHFWDTHDLTDFEDELEVVDEPIFEPRSELSIPLKSKELKALNALAKLHDTSPANLIRQWVLERIETSQKSAT